MSRATALLAALLLAAPLSTGSAQTAARLLTDGVAAYEDLDFAQAAQLLGRALALGGQLSSVEQAQALTYLAAAEVFRERPDAAAAAFRGLLLLDPRERPDSLRFPPRVRRAFEDTRQATKVALAFVPRRATLTVGRDTLTAPVYASSFHDIAASIERDDGTALRVLYSGPIRDSLVLQWDGRAGGGEPVSPGQYRLALISRGADGATLRSVIVPLEISAAAADTLPLPVLPDSLLLPQRSSSTPGLIALAAGAMGSGLVALLPGFAGASGEGGSVRFVVAGVLGAAGLAGLVHGVGRTIPERAAANAAVREAWQRQVARVRQENDRLRSGAVLTIRSGPPVRVEGEPR